MKQINEKISELEVNLPYGAKKEIATRAGISYQTVYRFFKGHQIKPSTKLKIIRAIKAMKKEEKSFFSSF